ncbi:MAG: hypothetical protein P1U88_21740 [Thalassobaculaceae bacterium]|nr:hypothetical protein [Thalassobaculaceae bacterium]
MFRLLLLTALLAFSVGAHPAAPAMAETPAASPADTEAALREIIGELRDETIVGKRYSPTLSKEIGRQRDLIFPTLKAAGPLKALKHLSSSHSTPGPRVDQFIAEHENASFVWTISIDPDETITLLLLAPKDDVTTPEQEQSASAGATLTEIIGELREEKIVNGRYSAALTEEIERQRAFLFPTLKAAGPLKSLRFLNATPSGSGHRIDQFLAQHVSASFLWTISLDDAGVADLLLVQPAG